MEKGEKYWSAVSINLDKPKLKNKQVYIKGKASYYDRGKKEYVMIYNVETYYRVFEILYVEKCKFIEIERIRDFDVLVRVDKFGNSVIKRIVIK